jgi:hypothetical protein
MRIFEMRFCERCQCEREFSRRAVAHPWHFGLTMLTVGLWSLGWLAATISARRRPWRCTACQSRFVPSAKRHPQMRQPITRQIKLPITPRNTRTSEASPWQ